METLTAAAVREAQQHGHPWVGAEHLLLVLTREPRGSAARDALSICGIEESDVAAYLAGLAIPIEIPSQPSDSGVVRPNPRYYKIVARAEGFALGAGSRQPRPEHFLLAMAWGESALHVKSPAVTPAALQAALAQAGVAVPPFEPPPLPEFGEAISVSESELPALLDKLEPLLSPPEITVGVRREGDRAWVMAAPSIDLRAQVEQLRSER